MGKLIEKYKVSEKDIYTICFAKNKKLGFSKTVQIKNAILKPYKVKFLEQAALEKEITEAKSHENEELVKKYGEIDLSEFEKKSTNKKGSKVGGFVVIGVIVLFIFWLIGSFGGGVDLQDLTNKYSGEYEGVIPTNTGYSILYNIKVDPIKKVKKNEYEAYVTGWAEDLTFGDIVTLKDSKMTITISKETNPDTGELYAPKICLYASYGSNILGGDPCDPYFSENIEVTKSNGDTVIYEQGIIHKGYVLEKIENLWYEE
tara:strand:+ start:137 stop:913 length:777 start_codon:yes stop_codon:yes gene_type:complete